MTFAITAIIAIALGLLAGYRYHRDGRPIRRSFGLALTPWGIVDVGAGIAITTLAMAGVFAIELGLGGIRVLDVASGGAIAGDIGLLVFGAVVEEVLFRVLLLSGLVVLLGGRKWTAILLSAAVFGIVHLGNPGATPISAFGNALGGVIYGMAFLGARCLWLPLGLHFGWNLAQGIIFGFPVSGESVASIVRIETLDGGLLTGGAYGPEAGAVGILARFAIMALVAGYMYLRAGRRGDLRTLEFPIAQYA